MNYVLLFLMFTFDAIFLQPLKILISIFVLFGWKPDVSSCLIDEFAQKNYKEFINVDQIKRDAETFNPECLIQDGDGFKYLTIFLGSLINRYHASLNFDEKEKELREIISSYISHRGIIGRYPIDNSQRMGTVNFSGDMTAGMLFWLAKELTYKDKFLEGYDYLKENLIKLFNATTFDRVDPLGNSKSLLCFIHASVEDPSIKPEEDQRGFIYRIYGLGPDLVRLLAWLKIGHLVTGEKRYLIFYHLVEFFFTPLLLVNSGDYGIFYKKFQAVAWYTAHSNMYCHTALYLLSESGLIYTAAKRLVINRMWNMDIRAVWNIYFEQQTRHISDTGSMLYPLIKNSKSKGLTPYSGTTQKYFDLRKFTWIETSDKWLLPEMLGHKYLWENNPLKPSSGSDARRRDFTIDRIIASLHLLQ